MIRRPPARNAGRDGRARPGPGPRSAPPRDRPTGPTPAGSARRATGWSYWFVPGSVIELPCRSSALSERGRSASSVEWLGRSCGFAGPPGSWPDGSADLRAGLRSGRAGSARVGRRSRPGCRRTNCARVRTIPTVTAHRRTAGSSGPGWVCEPAVGGLAPAVAPAAAANLRESWGGSGRGGTERSQVRGCEGAGQRAGGTGCRDRRGWPYPAGCRPAARLVIGGSVMRWPAGMSLPGR